MGKPVILLGSKRPGSKNDVRQVNDLAGTDFKVLFWEDLFFDISKDQQKVVDNPSGFDLSDAGLAVAVNWYRSGKQSIYKDVAFSLALYLDSKKVNFWNREMVQQRSTSKLSAMMLLALQGYDIPATQYSLTGLALRDNHGQAFPCIVKAAAASRGRDNHLVSSAEELDQYLNESADPNPYLIQEYIPNNGDLRIVCAGGQPQLVIKRQGQAGGHLNNTSQGAKAELLEVSSLSPDIIRTCQDICRLMGREMAGIDLIISDTDPTRQVFLEVNAVPQLTSGVFVNEKIQALVSSISAMERN